MKNLVLIRHAKSSWDDPGLDDLERPLNGRGKRDAPLMGTVLKERGLSPDIILTSPARRALKTAKVVAERLGFPTERLSIDGRIYLCGTATLLDLIQQLPDASDQVVVFGHNPDLTDLVNLLADAGIGNLPTCGAASLDFAVDSWAAVAAGAGRLRFFDYPKRHRTDRD